MTEYQYHLYWHMLHGWHYRCSRYVYSVYDERDEYLGDVLTELNSFLHKWSIK
jgi:hypothetical protein